MRYEYRCEGCEREEVVRKSHEYSDREERCSECGEVMKRVWGSPSIVFRGSGYHVTDYR